MFLYFRQLSLDSLKNGFGLLVRPSIIVPMHYSTRAFVIRWSHCCNFAILGRRFRHRNISARGRDPCQQETPTKHHQKRCYRHLLRLTVTRFVGYCPYLEKNSVLSFFVYILSRLTSLGWIKHRWKVSTTIMCYIRYFNK